MLEDHFRECKGPGVKQCIQKVAAVGTESREHRCFRRKMDKIWQLLGMWGTGGEEVKGNFNIGRLVE